MSLKKCLNKLKNIFKTGHLKEKMNRINHTQKTCVQFFKNKALRPKAGGGVFNFCEREATSQLVNK